MNTPTRTLRPKLLDPNLVAGNLYRRPYQNILDLRADLSPDRMIELLMQGNQQFVAMRAQNITANSIGLSAAAQGKTPVVAILNYARLDTATEHIFGQKFCEFFIINSADRLPHPQEISGIEYSVLMLGVKVVVVLGETPDCGDRPEPHTLNITHDRILFASCHSLPPIVNPIDRVMQLQSTPLLGKFVQAGQLKIVAAWYNAEQVTIELPRA